MGKDGLNPGRRKRDSGGRLLFLSPCGNQNVFSFMPAAQVVILGGLGAGGCAGRSDAKATGEVRDTFIGKRQPKRGGKEVFEEDKCL